MVLLGFNKLRIHNSKLCINKPQPERIQTY